MGSDWRDTVHPNEKAWQSEAPWWWKHLPTPVHFSAEQETETGHVTHVFH